MTRIRGGSPQGVELTEAALERISDAQVRFVLGHHPLHWLQEDQAQRLRALFGHHRAIYLHGHLHKAEGSSKDGAGSQFLVFQAGAAFQVGDDEPWHNGLLWGQVDLAGERVLVSPRVWNPAHYDWPVATGRFPENRREQGSDSWAYRSLSALERSIAFARSGRPRRHGVVPGGIPGAFLIFSVWRDRAAGPDPAMKHGLGVGP
jgi:hypothetical protein